jgi:aspartyl-tRNA(Asn)/glutamyl-tRNA(Gln) amidotransferase subunit C
MSLTLADVERIAALAHLELTAEEKDVFGRQLAGILDYAQQLQAVDTTGVPAMSHVARGEPAAGDDAQRHERPDTLEPSLAVEDALANAPDPAPEAGLFRVPRVIG